MKMLTSAEMLTELGKRLAGETQKALAEQLGFTPQFVNDVMRGRREITAKLAQAMGYERKVYFVRNGK